MRPKALQVPHAGFVYSGIVAAQAYRLIEPFANEITRVVLLGPTHRVAVKGIALPGVSHFDTPLGRVEIDQEAIALIDDLPFVGESREAHAQEHCLEVQIPFLQMLLPQFKLLPLAVSDASPEQVQQVIERLWGGPETLILISSDLSHYHPYDEARNIDWNTVQTVLARQAVLNHEQACGATAWNGMLLCAERHGLAPRLVSWCNSGDTAGDKSRVVGYSAFAFVPKTGRSEHFGKTLVALARNAIASQFGLPRTAVEASDAELNEPGAVFVTLTIGGQLRGCIGSLVAQRPLLQDVTDNALKAAFCDPRFPPLLSAEFPNTNVEVSLLTKPVLLPVADEADALAKLRPGIDGVILQAGEHRSTYLPSVWEQLPDPAQFLAQLKVKAGLPANWWSPQVRLFIYQAEKFPA